MELAIGINAEVKPEGTEEHSMATRAAPKVLSAAVFDRVSIAAGGNAIGPPAGLDLTGYDNYRLVLRFDGSAGTPFTINELYGPAGAVQQLNIDVDSGTVDSLGMLNYRKKLDIFGPKSFHIRVFNLGTSALQVSGSIYAVQI